MRYVISADAGQVSAHFGRCPQFTIVDIENNEVTHRETIANPGHMPAYLPEFFHQQGAACIVAGGMGQRARMLFDEKGIRTVTGVSGSIEDVTAAIVAGTLSGGENSCIPESGKGYGLDKQRCDHPHS